MNIWNKENFHGSKSPLTDFEITRIESEIGASLPQSYKEILKAQNGGTLIYNALKVEFENSWFEGHLPLTSLYGISLDYVKKDSKLTLAEWGIDDDSLLISGDGTYLFFFRYLKGNSDPAVFYFDISTEHSSKVASSFDELLSKLYLHDYSNLDSHIADVNHSSEQDFKQLVNSEKKDDIILGFVQWTSNGFPSKELISSLLNHLEFSRDPDIVMLVAEELTKMVVNGDTGNHLSKEKLLSVIENKQDGNLKVYMEMLNDIEE